MSKKVTTPAPKTEVVVVEQPKEAVQVLESTAFGPDRDFNQQFVPWMTVLFPAVNATEYRKFRKAHGMTHHDATVKWITDEFADFPSREAIVDSLVSNFVRKDWLKHPDDDQVQIAQYLGQLTARGWNGLINAAVKVFEGRL